MSTRKIDAISFIIIRKISSSLEELDKMLETHTHILKKA